MGYSINFRSMESKKYQDYSFKLLSNINHNKRTSAFDTTVSYGNIKDANKQINLEAQLDRKIKSWTEASLSLNGKLEIGTVRKLTVCVKISMCTQLVNFIQIWLATAV